MEMWDERIVHTRRCLSTFISQVNNNNNININNNNNNNNKHVSIKKEIIPKLINLMLLVRTPKREMME